MAGRGSGGEGGKAACPFRGPVSRIRPLYLPQIPPGPGTSAAAGYRSTTGVPIPDQKNPTSVWAGGSVSEGGRGWVHFLVVP